MKKFIQLHLLTSYPPANLNRDDLGRPKTAVFGGTQRLRISSQALKRAWRCSDVFKSRLENSLGVRTRIKAEKVLSQLIDRGMEKELAESAASKIARGFDTKKSDREKPKVSKEIKLKQLIHFSPTEVAAINELCETLLEEKREPTAEEVDGLSSDGHGTPDIALFGRMLAAISTKNVEASAQVAHALGVHASVVEDDYFSAVDDLNTGEEDLGAGHIGELGFGAGLFYTYICVDWELLAENLDGDQKLIEATIKALVEAAATVAPSGKQNSFGSRAYSSFILAETGDAQPRSLSVAFLDAVNGDNLLSDAAARLLDTRQAFASTYGERTDSYTLDTAKKEGTLDALMEFICSPSQSPA